MLDGGTEQKGGSSGGYGANLAPIEPLRKIDQADSWENSSFAQFCRQKIQSKLNKNYEERRQIAHNALMMASVRSGKMVLDRDPIYGSLALIPHVAQRTDADLHVYPLAQVNSSQLTSHWTLSRPRSRVRHFGNTNRAQIQRALIEKVIDHYDAEWMDEMFHQRESLSAMDYGTVAIEPVYDDKLNKLTDLMPVIQDVDKTVFAGYAYCMACKQEGTPDDFPPAASGLRQCQRCGSFNVSDPVPPEVVRGSDVVGYEQMSQGDIRIDLQQIGSLNWDMRHNIQDSSWVDRRTEISKRLIESIIGIEVNEQDPNDDDGLRVINAVGTRGGSLKGMGRENLMGHEEEPVENTTVMYELWLKPEEYAGERSIEDEQTVSGAVIPKGVRYEEIFPKGLCLVAFNDGDVLVSATGERCRIKSFPYHIQSNSGVGKGTTDTVPIIEQLSSAYSAALATVTRLGAGGGHAYDADTVTRSEARRALKPGGLVGVKMRGSRYTSVDQVMKRIETGELNQSNMVMINQLGNLVNISFQTTDFTSGVADQRVDVNTLGGQQMLEAQNRQRSAAPLRLKGWGHSQVFEEVVDLFREFIKIPRSFGTQEKFGLTGGRMISGSDLPENIKCDWVNDSELPTNTLIKRDNAERMLRESGLTLLDFAQVAMATPRLAAWWADQFQTEIPLFNYNEILIRCQERLDEIAQACQVQEMAFQLAGIAPDPAMLAEQILDELESTIFPEEEHHAIKAQTIQEYLDDDEVKQWSPQRKMTVRALIARHYMFDAQFRAGLAGLEMQGQLGVQAQADAAAKPQMDAQHDQAVGDQVMGRIGDEMTKEADFDREEEGKSRDHKRNLELERAKAKGRSQPRAGSKTKRS